MVWQIYFYFLRSPLQTFISHRSHVLSSLSFVPQYQVPHRLFGQNWTFIWILLKEDIPHNRLLTCFVHLSVHCVNPQCVIPEFSRPTAKGVYKTSEESAQAGPHQQLPPNDPPTIPQCWSGQVITTFSTFTHIPTDFHFSFFVSCFLRRIVPFGYTQKPAGINVRLVRLRLPSLPTTPSYLLLASGFLFYVLLQEQ